MIRLVLAVLLAGALVSAAAPAVERATVHDADAAARREVAALREVLADLARSNDAVEPANYGARRTVSVRFPRETVATAEFRYVAIGGVPDGDAPVDGPESDVVAYRVAGGERQVVAVEEIDVRVVDNGTVRDDGTPLVLRDDATVTLWLVRWGGERIVLVAQGFKPENGTSASHAGSAGAVP